MLWGFGEFAVPEEVAGRPLRLARRPRCAGGWQRRREKAVYGRAIDLRWWRWTVRSGGYAYGQRSGDRRRHTLPWWPKHGDLAGGAGGVGPGPDTAAPGQA